MYFLNILTLISSSCLFRVSLVRHIFLQSLFFDSIDLSRASVKQGLFCVFFFLLDTFCIGDQKLINWCTFLSKSPVDKSTLTRFMRSSFVLSILSKWVLMRPLLFSISVKSRCIWLFPLSISLVWDTINRN